ncbi:MAG: hypothetical protein K0R36_2111 [Chryseobacterium sp.]|jgi:short-subunit dehydrogenase|nr:hypothetical protein [Chryseobacterium sp.]
MQNLLCFSHLAWNFVYQRPQHLLTRFAKKYQVFYFEEPRIGSSDRYIVNVQDGVSVVQILITDHNEKTADLIKALISSVLREYNIEEYIIWYYTPMALQFTDHLKPETVIYDSMDELSAFRFAPPQLIQLEEALFKKADVVFTGGNSLYEAKKNRHQITGGASGIGRIHTLQLAGKGAKVAILDLNEQMLKETAALSPNIIPFQCDVTDLKMVEEVVAKVESEIGVIDRLINCAAIMPGGLLRSLSADAINKVMLINYCGMINVCQTIIPKMLERNSGDVIIYGSTAGIAPAARFGGYGATKAANNFYTKVLIEENKQSKVRILLVCPPAVDTPLMNQAKDGPAILQNPKIKRFIMIKPEEVVKSAERCLEKGKKICYPGVAKYIDFFYRFFPGLTSRMSG